MDANPYIPQALPLLITSILRRTLLEYRMLLDLLSEDDGSSAAQERARAQEAIQMIEAELALRDEAHAHYAEYGHHA